MIVGNVSELRTHLPLQRSLAEIIQRQQWLCSILSIQDRITIPQQAKATDDLAELKSEVLKAIRGQSKFDSDLLNSLIAEAEQEITVLLNIRDEAKRELDGLKYQAIELQTQYDEVMSWTELYDSVDLTAKKMIIANLINRIEVGTDYEIHIDFNIDLSQFKIECDCCA